MTVPAKLILLRILLIPVFLALFFSGLQIYALAVFALAAITDLFDGIIARARGQMTDFVKIMDPLADKLLICSALIALVSAGAVAAWLAILIVARDFIITGLRLMAAGKGAVLGAVITGKANTAFQMFLIMAILVGVPDIIVTILVYIVVILTVISTAENLMKMRSRGLL
ncbi:MAG: CDP-diacylglycerol--glycerol-3-phosphate 3-phosphatidyltransferase [Alphaproteobacteria bacterium]|nr:CDP-diacylglycerol--glycerol-3-phosphate 3-phosphatidyltransferase [Alphaproteobacteria bacterium]